MKRIIIIGGGASGLMAAYTALNENSEVVIIEKKERIGSKILATGNGHCNFTNEIFDNSCYYSEKNDFLSEAFKLFDNTATIDFFKNLGLPVRNKNGYYYPYNMEASSVLNTFRILLDSEKVNVLTETNVISINKVNGLWNVITDNGNVTGNAVIISCGSNASLKKALNNNIIKQIISLGHKFIPQKPALTYLKVAEEEIKLAAGVRFPVDLKLICDTETIASESGELQITARGISGICVFQLSRFISKNPDKKYKCVIDFMPEYSIIEISGIAYGKLKTKTDMCIEEMFNGILPKKLIIALAKLSELKLSKAVYLQEKELNKFIGLIKCCSLNIIGTGDVSESQCLTGGVPVSEINPSTMESLKIKDLYFTGEIIDVDGKCGGYNLQWAWTSGYIAGLSASEK